MVSTTSEEFLFSLLCLSFDLIYTLWEAKADNKENLFQALKYIMIHIDAVVVKVDLGFTKTWHISPLTFGMDVGEV